MIQRIQSVFLLMVALLMGANVFMPIWGKEVAGNRIEFNAISLTQTVDEQVTQQTTVYLAIIAGLTAVLAFWNIFNFKNRHFQMKITVFCILLISSFIATSVFLTYTKSDLFAPEMEGVFGFGFYLPVGAMLFNWLALRFIKKDEDTVRSADRLR